MTQKKIMPEVKLLVLGQLYRFSLLYCFSADCSTLIKGESQTLLLEMKMSALGQIKFSITEKMTSFHQQNVSLK